MDDEAGSDAVAAQAAITAADAPMASTSKRKITNAGVTPRAGKTAALMACEQSPSQLSPVLFESARPLKAEQLWPGRFGE